MFWPMELSLEFVLLVYTLGDLTVQMCIYGQDYCILLAHFVSFPRLGFKSKDMRLLYVGLAYQGKKDIVF
jgi:hypothetical protein